MHPQYRVTNVPPQSQSCSAVPGYQMLIKAKIITSSVSFIMYHRTVYNLFCYFSSSALWTILLLLSLTKNIYLINAIKLFILVME